MKLLLKISLLFLFTTIVYAKSALSSGALERMIQPKVTLESSYISDAKIKDSLGGYNVSKNTIRLNNAFLGLSYSNSIFTWNNIADLPFGDGVSTPIEEVHTYNVSLKLPYKIDDKWFLISSISGKSSFEDNEDDSYSFGMFSFASYKFNDDHTIQMGGFASYHPVSTVALPVLSYSYRARKSNGFKFTLGFPRTYIAYHLNKSTLLRLGMIYSSSVVKLSDESVISQAGFIETKNYMGNLGISYDVNKNLKIQTDVLNGLYREFNVYDSDGDLQNSYTVEGSLGVSFKVVYLF